MDKIPQQAAEILKGMIDCMTSDNDMSTAQIIESQARIIKQNEEIEWLKTEMSKADMGHSDMAVRIQEQAEEIAKSDMVIKAQKEQILILKGQIKEDRAQIESLLQDMEGDPGKIKFIKDDLSDN